MNQSPEASSRTGLARTIVRHALREQLTRSGVFQTADRNNIAEELIATLLAPRLNQPLRILLDAAPLAR